MRCPTVLGRTPDLCLTVRAQPDGSWAQESPALERTSSWTEIFMAFLSAFLYLFTLPFHLVFWTIAWAGRLTAILFGFCLMVVGMAFWAGPLFFVGIPLFLVGLLLTLKSLG